MGMNLPYKGFEENGRCEAFVDKRQRKMLAWLKKLDKMRKVQPAPKSRGARVVKVVRERKRLNRMEAELGDYEDRDGW